MNTSYNGRNQIVNSKYRRYWSDRKKDYISYSYDTGGRESKRIYGNGLRELRFYNMDNTIEEINGILSSGYSYDSNKNVIRQGGIYLRFWDASYDASNRLTSWTELRGRSQVWNLSLVGNWNSVTKNGDIQTREHNSRHQLKSTSDNESFSYDPRGNQVRSKDRKLLVWGYRWPSLTG